MKPVILLTAFLILFLSCQKAENHSCVGCYHPTPLTTLPPIPYDTTNLSGTFICLRADIDSYINNFIYASFYGLIGSQKNDIAYILVSNDTTTSFSSLFLNGCYYLPYYSNSLAKFDSVISWRVLDTSTFSFTFTDTNSPPYIAIISDTVINHNGKIALIDSIINTDSISIEVSYNSQYYSPAIDSIMLSSFSIQPDTTGYLPVKLTAYKHQYHTINGFRYLFIKEYVVQQNVWLK